MLYPPLRTGSVLVLATLSLLAGPSSAAQVVPDTGAAGAARAATPGRTLTPAEEEILGHLSIVHLDDGQGGSVKTLRISGINVQVVNGLGATNGHLADPDTIDPALTATNGLGNLIVGYNELGNASGDQRGGSHNIVFGHGNSFSSFGGMVGPHDSTIAAPFATVSGGDRNQSSAAFASVSGGLFNQACGQSASVSGGLSNGAGGPFSSVSGGAFGNAAGERSSVSGGHLGVAGGRAAAVSGGFLNRAGGVYASISGGSAGLAYGGGASISGGSYGDAQGYRSSVSGGGGSVVTGSYDWSAGSLFEDQ